MALNDFAKQNLFRRTSFGGKIVTDNDAVHEAMTRIAFDLQYCASVRRSSIENKDGPMILKRVAGVC